MEEELTYFPISSSWFNEVSKSYFFSRVSRSLLHAPYQVLTLFCLFSNANSREIREIPITNIFS